MIWPGMLCQPHTWIAYSRKKNIIYQYKKALNEEKNWGLQPQINPDSNYTAQIYLRFWGNQHEPGFDHLALLLLCFRFTVSSVGDA